MDAPLAQCTREEQRAVVRFLWSEGSSGTKIHQRLLAQYGDNALSKTTVYEWIEKFKTGRTSVKHAEGAGRPSTSTSEEKIEQAQQMILAILEDFLEKGSTINSASYCDLLANRLKPAIRTKRRGLLSKKVLLQHDNARPHVAKATIETINKLGFEVLEHPAYSPDLAPSDYHLFAPLKDALRGRKFSSDESVQKAVHQWLCDQPKTFFSDGIYKLVDRWNKCIEMGGDYVEK